MTRNEGEYALCQPNGGLPPVDRAMCLARGITAFEAATFGESVADSIMSMQLALNGEDVTSKWVRRMDSFSVGYTKVASDGTGKSRIEPPNGEPVAYEIDSRGHDPVTPEFIRLQEALGSDVNAERLSRCRAALDPSFGNEKIVEFRQWISKATKGDMHAVQPSHLVAFAQHISSLRADYAADVTLAAGARASCDMCIRLGAAGGTLEFHRTVFYLVAAPLSGPVGPIDIFGQVIRKAAADGFGEVLAQIAKEYGDRADMHRRQALESATLNEHLDSLYEAVPYQLATMVIHGCLAHESSAASEEVRSKARAAHKVADELCVRLRGPFRSQVVDLLADGMDWNDRCSMLAQLRERSGQDAAVARARDTIERHLIYPRCVLPDLIACVEGGLPSSP